MSKVDDADEAMTRYARGDETAFDIVYEAVAPRLASYLSRHVREKPRLEDIIQQTFLQMHVARGTFTIGAAVMPWAYAIARHLMIDDGRKARREQPLDFDHDLPLGKGGMASEGKTSTTSEQLVQAEQVNACLAAAYQRLSEPQRAAFELVKIEGLPYAQAAAILGTTVTGVKLRVHRVHLALRKALGVTEPPADAVRTTERTVRAPTSKAGRLCPAEEQ